MTAQDGFTQTARAAVDQHNQLLLAQAEALECPGIKHLLNHLQLRKVVATTNRSQSLVEFRGFKFRRSENSLAPRPPTDVPGRSADRPSG